MRKKFTVDLKPMSCPKGTPTDISRNIDKYLYEEYIIPKKCNCKNARNTDKN